MFYWLCYSNCPNFSSFAPLYPVPPFPPAIPSISSCPWVVHISSLATTFPILFLTSPIYFVPTNLYFSIPESFLPFSPFPLPTDNPPNELHHCDSVSVLLVCLVCLLDSILDSCEFITILMFIVLTFFFFLKKSL